MAKTCHARIDAENGHRRVVKPRLRIIAKETREVPTSYLRASSGTIQHDPESRKVGYDEAITLCGQWLSASPFAAALASTATARDGASARECSLRRLRSDGHAARVASALRVRRRPRRARGDGRAARAATANARAASSALMRCILAAPIRCIAPQGLVRRRGGGGVALLHLCASASAAFERAKPSAARARNRLRGASSLRRAARQYGARRAHVSPPSTADGGARSLVRHRRLRSVYVTRSRAATS